MPRYFFDLHDDITAIDEEGRECPDLESAKITAADEAREMIVAGVHAQGKLDLRHRIEVRDETNTVVHTQYFEDVLLVLRQGEPV
ncbi:MAG: hypothetical protein ABIN83_02000 [Sphingomicrobium sp.]